MIAQSSTEIVENTMGFGEVALFIGIGVIAFLFWGWLIRRIFKAYRDVPKELAGIRTALERIADQLEKKN